MLVLIATLDTKGDKADYMRQVLRGKGVDVLVVDVGVMGEPLFSPDISREKVAEAAGYTMVEVRALRDESTALDVMAKGLSRILSSLCNEGEVDGVIGIGGTMGSSLFVKAVSSLPIGVPKVLATTTLFGPHFPYEDAPGDLVVVPMVSDIWGLSSFARLSIENAAGAIWGVASLYRERRKIDKRFIGLTTLGTSTLMYVKWLVPFLEKRGADVLVFHVGGGQGKSYEEFIKKGLICFSLDLCLLDICPTNVRDPRFLRVNERLLGAVEVGVPAIVAPGAVNHLSFGGLPEDLPDAFRDRKMRWHSNKVLQVERSVEELCQTAELIADRISRSQMPTAVVVPKRGFQTTDSPGGLFYDPSKREKFIKVLKDSLKGRVHYIELDVHINDRIFAEKIADLFDSLRQ